MIHTIARVTRATDVVANIERADDEWLAQHSNDPVDLFVIIDDAPEVQHGWVYDPQTGTFSPPPAP